MTSNWNPFEKSQSYYDRIKELLSKVYELKKSGKPSSSALKLRQEISIYFTFLLDINRSAHLKGASARVELQACKEAFDRKLLQLENLLYHSQHLKKEIRSCLTLSSMHEQIRIMGEDELRKISKRELPSDAHELMKERLEWELQTRQQLSVQAKNLREEKSIREADNSQKFLLLSELSRVVERLSAKAANSESDLGIRVIQENAERVLAGKLVPSLYLLFVETGAYCRSRQLEAELGLEEIKKSCEEEETLHPVQVFLKLHSQLHSQVHSVLIRFAYDTYDNSVAATVTELTPQPDTSKDRWQTKSNLLTSLVVSSLGQDERAGFENLWVYCLAGMRPDLSMTEPSRHIAQTHTGPIVESLCRRVISRRSLSAQLEAVRKSGVEGNAKLAEWKLLSFGELKESLNGFSSGRNLEAFSARDGFCYSGQLQYEKYKLSFLLAVYFEYPDTAPYFTVSLLSPLTRPEDKQQEWRIEREMNANVPDQSQDRDSVLSRQLLLLTQMFVSHSELYRLQENGICIEHLSRHPDALSGNLSL